MRSILFIISTLTFLTVSSAMFQEDKRELFEEGDYFFARGDYAEAAYYFRQLVGKESNNSHFNFRLGECYMNIPGSEKLAIPCFEIASKKVTEKKEYRMRDFKETYAPLHAWFYLGNVYRVAGRLTDALNAYNVFINSPYYYGNYNLNVVENEIKSCERAKIIMDSPVSANVVPLDTLINTLASELNPVVSNDEKTIIFVRKLKFYDAILYAEREGETWGDVINMNPLIGSDGDFYPVSLSHDGNTLYLLRITENNKDIYITRRQNNSWTKASPLGKSVNTIADETWACESSDGKKLWFTSSRKGGMGGLDIYYATRDKSGNWGKAKNAGKVINTAFDEESPYPAKNDNLLFFSSKGHYSMGGYDIFYAARSGKSWKEPVNIGYPINTTNDDKGYIPVMNGRAGYYSHVDAAEVASSEDLYRIELRSNYPLP